MSIFRDLKVPRRDRDFEKRHYSSDGDNGGKFPACGKTRTSWSCYWAEGGDVSEEDKLWDHRPKAVEDQSLEIAVVIKFLSGEGEEESALECWVWALVVHEATLNTREPGS